ncbi:MAG: hypothetical protein ACK53Y_16330 [bacterium]
MSRAGPVPGTDRTVVSDETTLGPVLSVSGTGKTTRTADAAVSAAVRGRVRVPTISTWPATKKRHIFGWMTRTPGRVQPLDYKTCS